MAKRFYLRTGYGDSPIADGKGNRVGSLEEAIASLSKWEFMPPAERAEVFSGPTEVRDHIAYGREWQVRFALPIPRRNRYGGSPYTYKTRTIYCEEGAVVSKAPKRDLAPLDDESLSPNGSPPESIPTTVCPVCHKPVNAVAKLFGCPSGDSQECRC